MGRINKHRVLIAIGVLALAGCLSDNILEPVYYKTMHSIELLRHLEGKGDVFNSTKTPFLVKAQEVYFARDVYLIVDIRPIEEYRKGHIENSVNLSNTELFTYLGSINSSEYLKIVLVSSTGQAAAYYTCLLRLYGYENVYCLNYGMASWHQDLAQPWLSALYDYNILQRFNNVKVLKAENSGYPEIEVADEANSLEDILTSRVHLLMQEEFIDTLHLETDATLSIKFKEAIGRINGAVNPDDFYLLCFGDESIYYYKQETRLEFDGHPPGAILYIAQPPFYEFRSDKFLHTLPPDKRIIIYSYNGHLSAAAAAYLNLLGYNAQSVLFGVNNIFYSRLIDFNEPAYEWLLQWTFSEDEIHNYPYTVD